MARLRFATVWLGGCSGCHMSFLDLDEFLIDLAQAVDVVYTPIIDVKEYPENVDLVLVEGAVANEENLAMIRKVRERTRFVVALGDCAITGNVTALRNPLGDPKIALERSYLETAISPASLPFEPGIVPVLMSKVMPIQEFIHVDAHLTGCPPSGPKIREMLEQILAGGPVHLDGRKIKFG